MLEPNGRLIYLNELRPPAGYSFDRAVGTSYSLDLMSLLMVPLSMAVLDARRDNEGKLDPIGALEALGRTAERFVVFCQKGRITVPAKQQLLYGCLEQAVVEAEAPRGGAFHPKVWVIRFAPLQEGLPVVYRFICLSRNLTFDRSWDTALVLDGELTSRKKAFSRNRPLSHFVQRLPEMSKEDLHPNAKEHIDKISDEVLRVEFFLPKGFRDSEDDDLLFQPLGLPHSQTREISESLDLSSAKRMLVVSPFLNDGFIAKALAEKSLKRETTIISRKVSLDGLRHTTYKQLEGAGTGLFMVNDSAELGETEEELGSQTNEVLPTEQVSGLHAKLFAIDEGQKGVRVWTGSANATTPAFSGSNVEFLVGLRYPGRQRGIEMMVGGLPNGDESLSGSGPATLKDLLVPYERMEETDDEETAIRKKLEDEMENARKIICEADLRLLASPAENNCYNLQVFLEGQVNSIGRVAVSFVPVLLADAEARDFSELSTRKTITFFTLQPHLLTRFLACRLSCSQGEVKLTSSFVLKLPEEGFPEDRESCVVKALVKNRGDFLRLIMLILMDDDVDGVSSVHDWVARGSGHSASWSEALGIPLLEEMLRAVSRDPSRIGRIDERVKQLRKQNVGTDIIPPEFEEIWSAFKKFVGHRRGGGLHGQA